jgi:hypothetical protein
MIQSNFFSVFSSTNLFIYTMNNRTFLVLSNSSSKKYFRVPKFIALFKNEHKFYFKSEIVKQDLFITFIEKFVIWFSEKLVRKKVLLKGLGYKAMLLDDKKFLDLKIGFSHSVKILITPDRIKLKINKKTITIKGFIAADVGNFAEKIRRLKLPDSYKGKGIWYKNENRVLKLLKKK